MRSWWHERATGEALAALLARVLAGVMFGMVGYHKVFVMGPLLHAERFFIDGYAESWIPVWLLWGLGVAIPFVELLGGLMLVVGFRVKEAAAVLGALLVIVLYGHQLAEPFYDAASHLMPRAILLLVVLFLHRGGGEVNILSLDGWLARRRS